MRALLFFMCIALILPIVFTAGGGCSRNVDDVKANAGLVFNDNGFFIVGYQGYQLDPVFGGKAWYTIKKRGYGNTGIVYQAAIAKWFDEYHLYSLKAVDAIKP